MCLDELPDDSHLQHVLHHVSLFDNVRFLITVISHVARRIPIAILAGIHGLPHLEQPPLRCPRRKVADLVSFTLIAKSQTSSPLPSS